MPTRSEVHAACDIAEEAGRIALSYFDPDRMETREKGERDVVTAADMASEAHIRERLARRFPGDGIVGEEGSLIPTRTGRCWFIDPVDGTLNFSRGLSIWCVSLSLFEGEEPIIGVIYDPIHGEMFHAANGQGAYLADTSIVTSGVSEARMALVHNTVDFHDHSLQLGLEDIQRLAPAVLRTRNIGSAALALAYVAAGRLDAMVHRFANSWDYGAGALLVQEAGGAVSDIKGNPYTASTTTMLAASSATLHDDLVRVLTMPV